jgi:micrococcal nuclease
VRQPPHLGSYVLLALAAVAILRPWEAVQAPWLSEPPRSAWAYALRAVDGDTIEVRLDGHAEDVRYIGVDTPETVKPGTPVQCFGPRAHRFDQSLVAGRRVRLVFDAERRDVYGRLLAYVYVGGRFVNGELVRRGFARILAIPPNIRFAKRFVRLQTKAARAGRGLWGAC